MSIKTIDPAVSTMASLLGYKGGISKTPAQTKARKENAAKARRMKLLKRRHAKAA